jgi:probable F420-dependent oxidoreductase
MSTTVEPTALAADARVRLGPVGVWFGALSLAPAAVERDIVAMLEDLGYGALWIGESARNKEALAHAGLLLAASRRISIATGIANIWVRDATAAGNGADTLAEAHGGRFVLGLGVGHRPTVDTRGHDYRRPLSAMRTYLDALDQVDYAGPPPRQPVARVLAALRPRMLELARDRSAGAHPYFVPVEHTAAARAILGPEPLLAPEQAVVLETDPQRARSIAREHMAGYLRLPNYVNNLRDLGYGDDDLAGGGSDRLVDAIVAWGDVDAIRARVRAHHEAGADHVAVQALGSAVDAAAQLRDLAPALLT